MGARPISSMIFGVNNPMGVVFLSIYDQIKLRRRSYFWVVWAGQALWLALTAFGQNRKTTAAKNLTWISLDQKTIYASSQYPNKWVLCCCYTASSWWMCRLLGKVTCFLIQEHWTIRNSIWFYEEIAKHPFWNHPSFIMGLMFLDPGVKLYLLNRR